MKNTITLLLLLASTYSFSQKKESEARKFINKSQYSQVNSDWNITAEFKSGLGEYVKFFPVEIIDLKNGEKIKALQLNMFVKTVNSNSFKTAWVGTDEVNDFIEFVEKYVTPNLKMKLDKKKTTEFVFAAKEMTLTYSILGSKRRLTIKLNSYDNDLTPNYTFWTQSQVNKIPNLLTVLKEIK